MSSIDERVVEMKFDNSLFQRGVQTTLSALDSLKKGLQLKGAGQGLEDISAKANRVSFAGIQNGLQGLADKFKMMSIVGITALTNVTNKAVDAGLNLAKSLSISPIMDGFQEYELKMGSIQTILANTAKDGTTLKQVTAALDELNHYADQTIYNFGDMTKNIGLFTNAGIKLKDATSMIQGFSNEAAASGTNAQGAASAAYQLSQALTAGKITLMDWRSLQNVGMGNANMKAGILDIADAMGTMKAKGLDAKTVQKDFNGSLEKGWLTADVMSTYLKIMATDYSKMSAKQLAAQKTELKGLGLSDQSIDRMIKQQKTAQEAATKVRTLTQLMGTLKESIGSGWASTFDQVFGNFDEATVTFTKFSKMFGTLADNSAKARAKLIGDWKKNGGRLAVIDGLVAGFEAFLAAIKPIKEAFKDIFPPMTGKQLAEMSKSFRDFMKNLKMGPETAAKVKAVFKGLFATFSIGLTIGKKIFQMFGDLWRKLTEGDGAWGDLVVKISDWLVGVDQALKKGQGLKDFFRGLTSVLSAPIVALKTFAGWLRGLFTGEVNTDAVTGAFDRVKSSLNPMQSLGDSVRRIWSNITQQFQAALSFFKPVTDALGAAFSNLFGEIKKALSTNDFSGVLDAINTGLFGALIVMIRKFQKDGIGIDIGGGFLENLSGTFEGLTDTLGAMQAKLKADVIMKIAGAVALLAGSIVLMSLIPSDKLAQSTAAITGLFAGLLGAMKMLDTVVSLKGAAKMPALAIGIGALAVALLILSAAVKNLAGLNWEELAKGLTGVVGLLLAISGAVKLMSGNTKGMITAGIGITALAIGIKILVSAVKDFASMDWGAMAKGLVGVSSLLLALGIFTKIADANKMGIKSGAGLILLGIALKILYSSVKDFAGMNWDDMGKGMAGMAGALGIVAAAMNLMPKNMLVSAVALVAVAGALVILSGALGTMGGMSWDEIGKGLVTLAGSLGIIAAAMALMSGALPGAAALIIVAGALAILTPVLTTLGALDIPTIATALGTLAAVFAVLGAAGLVLTPVVPTLMGLGVAIALLGAGTALAGVGLLAMSAGLTALSVAGVASGAAITAIGTAIIGLIPMALKAVGEGLVLLAGVISNSAPQFLTAMVALMTTLLKGIDTVAPRIVDTILRLIGMLLTKLSVSVPQFVNAGMRLITGVLNGIGNNIGQLVTAGVKIITNFLNGIANNVGKIVTAGTNIVTKFLDAIAKSVPKIVTAGFKMITDILKGVTDSVNANSAAMGKAGGDLAVAIIRGMVNGIAAGVGQVVEAARNMAANALNAAKEFLGIHSPSREFKKIGAFVVAGFRDGIDGNKAQVQASFESLKKMLTDMKEHSKKEIEDQEKRLYKLTHARKKDKKAIAEARAELALARAEFAKSSAAYTELTKKWTDDKNKLGSLAAQYDALGVKLKAANQKLVDAKKTRDDYNASVKSQYSDLPDINGETKLQDFANDLRKQIADTQAFSTALQKLRTLGLSDQMYKELLSKGTSALPFVNELLATGKSGVTQVNDLGKQLESAAGGLANSASKALYQAAVDSAAGLVKGLEAQRKNIEKQMDFIADAMVKAIKKKLGIKSPSREFMKVGKYSSEGLAEGLKNYGYLAEKSAENVGLDAINAMRKTIVGMDDIIGAGVDINPTVKPVLDLTAIRKDATKIGHMLKARSVSVDASYGQAKGASVGYAENQKGYAIPETVQQTKQVTYIQNINSPKAVSPAEVYRGTKNQLSNLRGALNK